MLGLIGFQHDGVRRVHSDECLFSFCCSERHCLDTYPSASPTPISRSKTRKNANNNSNVLHARGKQSRSSNNRSNCHQHAQQHRTPSQEPHQEKSHSGDPRLVPPLEYASLYRGLQKASVVTDYSQATGQAYFNPTTPLSWWLPLALSTICVLCHILFYTVLILSSLGLSLSPGYFASFSPSLSFHFEITSNRLSKYNTPCWALKTVVIAFII